MGKQEKSDRSRFLDHSSLILRSPTREMTVQAVTVFAEQSGYSSDRSCLALGKCLGRVLQDELDDLVRILEGMRMVSNSRFTDDLNLTSQLLKPLLQDGRIFCHRDDLITSSYHVQQGHFLVGQWFQMVDRVPFEFQRPGFGQTVSFQAGLPGSGTSFTGPFASWPALDIADRRIAVDTSDLFGIVIGPVVDDEASATHPFQGNLPGEVVLAGQVVVEIVPVPDGCRIAEQVGNVAVGHVKTMF